MLPKRISNRNIHIINNDNYILTIILFHPMYNDYTSMLKYCNNNKFRYILIQSPIININWPNNIDYNVNSWYNYYSDYSGLNKQDNISLIDLNNISIDIQFLIKQLKNDKLILGGISQGATIALHNSLHYYNNNIIGVFSLRSILLKHTRIHKKINKKLRIFTYNGNNDKIYIKKLYLKSFIKLNKFNVDSYIEQSTGHNDTSFNEFKYLNNWLNILNDTFRT